MEKYKGFEFVSSRDNERVKRYAKLASAKFRESERLFLAEGVKLTREALEAGNAECVLIRESTLREHGEIARTAAEKTRVTVLSDPAFEKITTENSPQGVITVSRFMKRHMTDSELPAEKLSGRRCIALDCVRDPGNLGAVFRSALAFGFDTVLMGDCVDLYNPRAVRATMGAVYRMDTVTCRDLREYLTVAGRERRIIGACLEDKCHVLGRFIPGEGDIVVIGNEGSGLRDRVREVCSDFLKIPMGPYSESLNAACAASVILWEYSKHRR